MQKGFIQLSLTGYIALSCAAVIGLVSAYAYIQTKRLEAANQKLAVIEAIGLEAQKKAKQQEAKDKLNKERADAELKKLRLANGDLSKRLRDNAGSSFVPRTSPSTNEPERACFDQSAIDSAIKRFAERASGIAEEGQSAIDSLNNARQWANGSFDSTK